jgi:tetratricopeptide (TPR) repeat protein
MTYDRYDDAIKDATQAMRYNPNMPTAYYNRARARYTKEANPPLDEILADLNKAIELNPRTRVPTVIVGSS